MENLNLKELNNLKILNITFENDKVFEKQKEIILKDIFPNLIELKIITRKKDNYNLRDYERSKGPIFIISLNLFSQMEDLTLIRTSIKIENLTNGMTFPSLKNLKIKYTDIIGNLRTNLDFPNLKYFYSEENEDVSVKKFSLSYYCFFWNISLDEIHLNNGDIEKYKDDVIKITKTLIKALGIQDIPSNYYNDLTAECKWYSRNILQFEHFDNIVDEKTYEYFESNIQNKFRSDIQGIITNDRFIIFYERYCQMKFLYRGECIESKDALIQLTADFTQIVNYNYV